MKKTLTLSVFFFGMLIIGCNTNNVSNPTEKWHLVLNAGTTDYGDETFTKSGNTTTSSGTWHYGPVVCSFSNGTLSVNDTTVTLSASGTATNSSAPSGYQQSAFTLSAHGSAHSGSSHEGWVIRFTGTFGWPDSVQGIATGTRTSGTGITN